MKHRLRKLRKKRGLSVERLAELVDVDRSTMIRTEAGDLFAPKFRRICEVLDIAPAELLELRDYPPDLRALVDAYERVPENSRARVLRMLLAFLEDDDSPAATASMR